VKVARATATSPSAPKAAGYLRATGVALVSSLLVWPLFPGGLYLESYQIIAFWHATVAAAVMAALGMLERRPFRLTPARLAALSLWLAYFLSALLAAAAPREAVGELIKQGLLVLAFLLTSELVGSAGAMSPFDGRAAGPAHGAGGQRPAFAGDGRRLVLGGAEWTALILWAGAAALSLASLLSAVGLLPFPAVVGDRLWTYLGYPNSAGSLVAAAFLVGLGLRRLSAFSGALPATALAMGQWALLVAFVLTMSRGAWLVFPVALLLTLVLWPGGQRLAALAELFFAGLAAVVIAPFLGKTFGNPGMGAVLIGVGCVLAAVTGLLATFVARLPGRRRLALAVAGAVLAVAVGAGFWVGGALPRTLVSQITGFSLSERSAWERLTWTTDALAIARDHPLLGVGGGGWSSVYFQYQRYGYYTLEAHNDLAETLAETGAVGFLALLALLAATGHALWRMTAGRGRERPILVAALGGAVVMLVLHSALDLNLSLGSIGVYLWALFGVVDGLATQTATTRAVAKKGVRAAPPPASGARGWLAVVAWAFLVSLVALSLLIGTNTARQAMAVFGEDPERALLGLRFAGKLDPWSPNIRVAQAEILDQLARSEGGGDYASKARQQYLEAIRLDPYRPDYHSRYGFFCLSYGDFETGVRELDRALDLQPCEVIRYEEAGEAHLVYGQFLLKEGQRSEAGRQFQRVIVIAERLGEQSAKTPDYVPDEMGVPPVTPLTALWAGKAQAFLGNWHEAIRLLGLAHDAGSCRQARETEASVKLRRDEAVLWLALVEQRLGEAEAASDHLAEALKSDPSARAMFDELEKWIGQAVTP